MFSFSGNNGNILPTLSLDTRKQVNNRQYQVDSKMRTFFGVQLCDIASRPLVTGIKGKPLGHAVKLIAQTGIGVLPVFRNHI